MVRVCAWCQKFIGLKPGGGLNGVTHGICKSCMTEFKDQS